MKKMICLLGLVALTSCSHFGCHGNKEQCDMKKAACAKCGKEQCAAKDPAQCPMAKEAAPAEKK